MAEKLKLVSRKQKLPINQFLVGDCLKKMLVMPQGSIDLIYADPPFNTGKTQSIHGSSYNDKFDDYLGFLRPRLQQCHRLLKRNGSLFFHIDWRESARCRLLLDKIFGGQEHCINEIIWSYDYGGRSKSKWSTKHDTIYWYAKNPSDYTFNYSAIDRIPYMAPSLVGAEKAARGKTPTDVWWHTIVPTNSKERVDYPTQKPLGILNRIVSTHTNPADIVLDPFAGSGTALDAAQKLGCRWIGIDSNPDALEAFKRR